MAKMKTPNPGSPAATQQGCLCAVIDNHHGEGFPWRDGPNKFWISADCPLHGPWSSAYAEDNPVVDCTREER